MPSNVSRRSLLRTTAATGLGMLGALAGCSGPAEDGTTPSKQTSPPRVDTVPAGRNVVAHVDVAGLLADSAFRSEVNENLRDGSMTVEKGLSRFETRAGVDPRGIEEILVSGAWSGGHTWTVVGWTDWTQAELFDALKADDRSTETTYNGKPLLVNQTTDEPEQTVAVLEEGVFAVGKRPAVESVVDVRQGTGDTLGGPVRDAYATAQGGYVQFGFDVPTQLIPTETDGPVSLAVLEKLTEGYGSFTESRALVLNLRAENTEAAENAASVLQTVWSMGKDRQTRGRRGSLSWARQMLTDLEIDRTGSTVVVRTESGSRALAVLSEAGILPLYLGARMSDGRQEPVSPQVAFGFEYDAEAGTLSIRQEGGDTVPASELFVRGTGIDGGRWDRLGGQSSGEITGSPAVVAGDRVTLSGIDADAEVQVVWESQSGDVSTTLAVYEGPEA